MSDVVFYTADERTLARREAEKLVCLLCLACRMLEANFKPQHWGEPELRLWWTDQQRLVADKLREERETRQKNHKVVRATALAKLTREERKALGLS